MAKDVPGRLDDLRSALQEAAKTAPARELSAAQMVQNLLPDLLALRAKRFTDAEIVALLGEKGVKMSLGTFRQYLHRARQSSDETKVKTPRKASSTRIEKLAEQKAESMVNANVNATATPSKLAKTASPKANQMQKKLGHNLDDTDV